MPLFFALANDIASLHLRYEKAALFPSQQLPLLFMSCFFACILQSKLAACFQAFKKADDSMLVIYDHDWRFSGLVALCKRGWGAVLSTSLKSDSLVQVLEE